MSAAEIKVKIEVSTRPLWLRVVRFPFVCRKFFRIMRRNDTGVILSLYASWLLAGKTMVLRGPHTASKPRDLIA